MNPSLFPSASNSEAQPQAHVGAALQSDTSTTAESQEAALIRRLLLLGACDGIGEIERRRAEGRVSQAKAQEEGGIGATRHTRVASRSRMHWTSEEDDALLEAIRLHGEARYAKVVSFIKERVSGFDRNVHSCRNRYQLIKAKACTCGARAALEKAVANPAKDREQKSEEASGARQQVDLSQTESSADQA